MHAGKAASTFRFGTFELDTAAGELRKHGVRIKLQDQPFQLLVLLLRHPCQVITREELRHTLWSEQTFVDFDRGLNRAMNKLRAALCDSAETPRFIETLHRRGYRFIAPITILSQPENEGRFAGAFMPDPERASAPPAVQQTERRHTERRMSTPGISVPAKKFPYYPYLLGLFAAVVMVTVSVSYVRHHSATGAANSAVIVTPRRSVAVLGFKNLSERSGKGWLSTALADWLTTQLSEGGQLRLIPAENVARMKIELSPFDVGSLSGDSLIRVGKNLSTDLVVIGSYAVVGSDANAQARLDLRLQDARTGNIVEAVSETGTETHLFDLVLRAGERLRAKLGVQPVSRAEAAEVAVALPSNHDAARFYSEGLEALQIFDALGARDLLQRSISVEPGFALSHAALATAWATLGYDEVARVEAKRAFELSSNLPRADGLLVEARYHEMSKEWERSVDIYRALFQFFPDSLDYGLALADAQVNSGRGRDAMQTLTALQKLPPPIGDDARIDLAEALAAESLGDFKTDLACTVRAADKARSLGASLLLAEARNDQAWALANLGRAEEAAVADREAERIFDKAGDKRGLARSINYDGILMENQGNAVGAKKRYEEALTIYREIGYKLGVAAELDDLGDVLFSLGHLDGSRRNYQEAMAIYREVDHENGVCLTKGALGSVLLALGDDNGSIRISQEAVDICTRLGDRSKVGIALLSLGRALRLQGKTSEAREKESEAVSAFEEIGDKQSAERARLMLAELLLDDGKLEEARLSANTAADEFVKEKAARDAALAFAVLSQVLLREGNLAEARKSIQHAETYLSQCSDREAELKVAISGARIQAVSGGLAGNGAAKTLQEIAIKANRLGFVPYELEPRLAIAEIEVNLGDQTNARNHLEALRKEAMDRGFGLIAIKAAGDLKNLVPSNRN
jgi:DNA-binding winged helix-turn-helix (wHTH) protein/tetratricopeptide (TPR) repeat protein/TolB-like protein